MRLFKFLKNIFKNKKPSGMTRWIIVYKNPTTGRYYTNGNLYVDKETAEIHGGFNTRIFPVIMKKFK